MQGSDNVVDLQSIGDKREMQMRKKAKSSLEEMKLKVEGRSKIDEFKSRVVAPKAQYTRLHPHEVCNEVQSSSETHYLPVFEASQGLENNQDFSYPEHGGQPDVRTEMKVKYQRRIKQEMERGNTLNSEDINRIKQEVVRDARNSHFQILASNSVSDFQNDQWSNKRMRFGDAGVDPGQRQMAVEQRGVGFGQSENGFQHNGIELGRRGLDNGQSGFRFGPVGMESEQSGMAFGQNGMSFGQNGMSFGQNRMGLMQNGMEFLQNGMEFVHNRMGFVHNGMGFRQNGMGFGQSGMDTGQNWMGLGHSGNGIGQCWTGFGQNDEQSRLTRNDMAGAGGSWS